MYKMSYKLVMWVSVPSQVTPDQEHALFCASVTVAHVQVPMPP